MSDPVVSVNGHPITGDTMGLDAYLTLIRDFRAEHHSLTDHGHVYHCAEDFVLQHGTAYDPASFTHVDGAPRSCYGNSLVNATAMGWSYVEGYAMGPTGLVVQHAWCVRPDGVPVECTWPIDVIPALAYRGVTFSIERADDCTWNGDATVLDDYQRRWPLFQQPWQGEDYSIEWPDSPRLRVMRTVHLQRRGSQRAG